MDMYAGWRAASGEAKGSRGCSEAYTPLTYPPIGARMGTRLSFVEARRARQIGSPVRHYGGVSKRQPSPGSVIQVPLPDGRFAYGRVYRDATVCFYRYAARLPGEPPIGLRDFAFCVGVYDDVAAGWEVVGVDGFSPGEDNGWPPASGVKDPISGSWRVYHRGVMRAATEDEARGLEPAAVWDEHHLLPRLAEELPRADRSA